MTLPSPTWRGSLDSGTLEAFDAGVGLLESARRAERATLRVGLSGTAMVPVASETVLVFADVPSNATGGKLSAFQATMPEGFSPPRHVHILEDEVFLVLRGRRLLRPRRTAAARRPGASVYMPRGVRHTFRIQSPVARMLGVMVPGAFEALFRNLSVPAGERALPVTITLGCRLGRQVSVRTGSGRRRHAGSGASSIGDEPRRTAWPNERSFRRN